LALAAGLVLALAGWAELGFAMGLESSVVPSMARRTLDSYPYPTWVINGWGVVYILLMLPNAILQLPFILLTICWPEMPFIASKTPYAILLLIETFEETFVLYLFVQLPLQFSYYLTVWRQRRRHEESA